MHATTANLSSGFARIGIITASDRASAGEYQDRGGPAVIAWFRQALPQPFEAVSRIVADEQAAIEAALCALCDHERCRLVITTGGTGPARRDVTPQATERVCDVLLPGFGEQMRRVSVQTVPTAILSRQTAGIRGQSLIINLPGNPAAIDVCLQAVFPALAHCLELIEST